MKKYFDIFFSMKFSGALLLVFAAVAAFATFIENDLGTNAARVLVYNAKWFEILLLIISISMIGSVFQYRLIQRRKYSLLIFHLAFVLILLGAFVTRYFSYEGIMNIREGETTSHILTVSPYVQIWAEKGGEQAYTDKGYAFSPYKRNRFHTSLNLQGEDIDVRFKKFIPNAAEAIMEDPEGHPIVSFVSVDKGTRKNAFLEWGEVFSMDSLVISFQENPGTANAVHLRLAGSSLEFSAPYETYLTNMMASSTDTLAPGQYHPIEMMKLYSFNGSNIVFNDFFMQALPKITEAPRMAGEHSSPAVVFDVEYLGKQKEISVFGGAGLLAEPESMMLEGAKITIGYGSKEKEIPFSLKLTDFQLERYPGSMSPSSFASEVIVNDPHENVEMPYRIYMNNILNYKGYRFFQSSYDPDEMGTVLSVNHDQWGTVITYIGYFFLTLGLVMIFFSRKSRFRTLVRKASRIRDASRESLTALIFAGLLTIGFSGQAQDISAIDNAGKILPEHAGKFGSLLVQDREGRIKPMNTMSSEILRKVYRKDRIGKLNSDQVFLGMLVNPGAWQAYPMIKVSDPELKKLIGISGKYAAFNDFIRSNGTYKLSDIVDAAYNKRPVDRTPFDKDIIAVDERVNIVYMVYTGEFLNIFPKPDHENNKWYTAHNAEMVFDSTDAGFVSGILPLYYESVRSGIRSGDWALADEYLGYLKTFQERYGSDVLPSQSKIKLEILYNKVNIFKRLFPIYAALGVLMLILTFTELLSRKRKLAFVINLFGWLIFAAFLLHTAGLAARWYIAGRAPWSNGYETMIYISWGVVLAGLIFSRNSRITLATTGVLAAITLMVANLSWLNPEITNLVPVLKSYWLVIHVAVITASYSFLAIGALLGFLNLLLTNFMNRANRDRLKLVLDELTNIIEMNLIIGLVLITIGTFLGAVWANESWGRYWGWDPKETWALITVLVYSFVVHMRLIPGLKGTYAFNLASLLSFSSVLMTYFGVNYFLSGMHSYAQGDPAPVPSFVYWVIIIIAIVAILAYRNYRKSFPAGNEIDDSE